MLLIVTTVALAAVLAVSAAAKVLDRPGTRQAVAGFGVPGRLVGPVAIALAPAELVTAVLLVWAPLAGRVVALLLLAGFTVAVSVALRGGRRPECHCFGRLGGADVSARTVLRNLVLAGLAAAPWAFSSGEGTSGRGERLAATATGLAVAGLVVAAEAWAGRAARRRRERAAVAGFDVGSPPGDAVLAPPLRVPTVAGGDSSVPDLLSAGQPLLLVTLSPGCGPCKAMRAAVAEWAPGLAGTLTVAALATGTVEANRPSYPEGTPYPVLVDETGELRAALGSTGTPSAVLIGPDGRVRGGVATGPDLVRRLLAAALTGGPEGLAGAAEAADAGDEVSAASLEPGSVVAARSTVQRHPLGDRTLLVDGVTGASVVLDQLGALVWSLLDGHGPLVEISRDLAEVFEAPEPVVRRDVLELARSLARAGLLTSGVPAGSASVGRRSGAR